MKRGFGLVMTLFVLGLAFGCGGEGGAGKLCGALSTCGGDGDTNDVEREAESLPCAHDTDCRNGLCVEGFCRSCEEPCERLLPSYAGPGTYCDGEKLTRYETRACAVGGVCIAEVKETCGQKQPGTSCTRLEATNAACMHPCTENKECQTGESCIGGACCKGPGASDAPCEWTAPLPCAGDCRVCYLGAVMHFHDEWLNVSCGSANACVRSVVELCAAGTSCKEGPQGPACVAIDGDRDDEQEYASCSQPEDCQDGAVCYGGICCAEMGNCDFPCGEHDNENYNGPGLYCYDGNVYHLETTDCGLPCYMGATCKRTLVRECTGGCIQKVGAAPACVINDGDVDFDSERAYDCTTIGAPTENAACTQEGLRVCTDSSACSLCTGFRCTSGHWQKADEVDVSCEAGLSCDCKTYVTDGDEDCADGF